MLTKSKSHHPVDSLALLQGLGRVADQASQRCCPGFAAVLLRPCNDSPFAIFIFLSFDISRFLCMFAVV